MNLLLGLFLTIGSVVGSIKLVKHNFNKTMNMSLGGVNLPQLLNGGPSSLVKFLNNKPVPGDTTKEGMPSTGEGTANGMGIGGRPNNIRFDSRINNMNAENLQMGEIENRGVKARTINQGINSVITNEVKKGTFNMGNGVVNVVGERPGVKLNAATSNMVLTGDVRKLRAPGASNFRTQNLRITGVVTGGIMASKYVRKDKSKNYLAGGEGFDTEFSKKELKEIEKQERLDRRREIFMQKNMNSERTEAVPTLVNQNNVAIVLNEARINRINGYRIEEQQHTYLSADPNSSVTILGLKQVFLNPENSDLNKEQKFKLYSLNRMYKTEQVLASGMNNANPYSIENGSNRSINYDEVFSSIVREVPDFNLPEMMEIAKRVQKISDRRNRTEQLLARELTDSKMNLKQADKTSLDILLEQTSSVANNFNAYIEDNFKEDNIHTLSEAEVKEIEQIARENVEKREDISLEEKEKELEEERKKLEKEKIEKNLKAAEDLAKEEILKDPEQAKRILGEEGAEILKKELSNNRKKQDDYYTQILKRNSNKKDNDFRNKYSDEYNDAEQSEVHNARVKEETRQDIKKAARELYGDNSSNKTNRGQIQVSQNNVNTQKEPQVKEVVYISPQVQQYVANEVNRRKGLNTAGTGQNRMDESFSNNLEYANVLNSAGNQEE